MRDDDETADSAEKPPPLDRRDELRVQLAERRRADRSPLSNDVARQTHLLGETVPRPGDLDHGQRLPGYDENH